MKMESFRTKSVLDRFIDNAIGANLPISGLTGLKNNLVEQVINNTDGKNFILTTREFSFVTFKIHRRPFGPGT